MKRRKGTTMFSINCFLQTSLKVVSKGTKKHRPRRNRSWEKDMAKKQVSLYNVERLQMYNASQNKTQTLTENTRLHKEDNSLEAQSIPEKLIAKEQGLPAVPTANNSQIVNLTHSDLSAAKMIESTDLCSNTQVQIPDDSPKKCRRVLLDSSIVHCTSSTGFSVTDTSSTSECMLDTISHCSSTTDDCVVLIQSDSEQETDVLDGNRLPKENINTVVISSDEDGECDDCRVNSSILGVATDDNMNHSSNRLNCVDDQEYVSEDDSSYNQYLFYIYNNPSNDDMTRMGSENLCQNNDTLNTSDNKDALQINEDIVIAVEKQDSVCLLNISKNEEPLAARDQLWSKDNTNNADKACQSSEMSDITEIHVDRMPTSAEDPVAKDCHIPNTTHSLSFDEAPVKCVQSSPSLTQDMRRLRNLENVPTEKLIAQLKRRHSLFSCLCGASFLIEKLFRHHEVCHTPGNLLLCAGCHQKFSDGFHFNHHLLLHLCCHQAEHCSMSQVDDT